jgi:hypothetical protein
VFSHPPIRQEGRKEGMKERRGKENKFLSEKRREVNFMQIVELIALFVATLWSK